MFAYYKIENLKTYWKALQTPQIFALQVFATLHGGTLTDFAGKTLVSFLTDIGRIKRSLLNIETTANLTTQNIIFIL